jgi:uracil-DNA glycosylase
MPSAYVEALAAAQIGETCNFYREGERAGLLRSRVCAYLEERAGASLLLCGEAPGYRGTRISGIPFTSERQISGEGPAEASATIVHRVLDELGLADDVVCWNVVPTHPHRPREPASNRPPNRAEIDAGRPFLEALAHGRRVLAVGRVAHAVLGGPYVRHPAHGGAAEFREGLLHFAAGGRGSAAFL